MKWLAQTLTSSIGKKLLMALTGFCFCLFLAAHLAGNLTIYGGESMFNGYAEHLHSLGILLNVAEWGLLIMAIVHIATGLTLFFQNLGARPTRYMVNKKGGGRTIGSGTMPYTGILLLAFIIFHLVNFHFADKSQATIYDIVTNAFESPLYVILYVVAMIITGLHVSHGFWSAFQTIGANHPKYMPMVKTLSVLFALAVGIGFGLLPIYISISA